jgi:segregation and condensation protein A
VNEALRIDVDGFEGPLVVLLALARLQKVDLAKISILDLAHQYLKFIKTAQTLTLENAADYLIMATWLVFLKSKLLIPNTETSDEPSGDHLVSHLQFRLKRLEAMRDMTQLLHNRHRIGRDVFVRGMPENIELDIKKTYLASFYDLVTAYSAMRQRKTVLRMVIQKRIIVSLKQARAFLQQFLYGEQGWVDFKQSVFLNTSHKTQKVSIIASSFAASLELVREGKLHMRQEGVFEPIYMRFQHD